jgi:coenzyme F420 hydrogenase subunit beta
LGYWSRNLSKQHSDVGTDAALSNSQRMSILINILQTKFCTGCGVCAGICPRDALVMRFNEFGEWRPSLSGECSECGLCTSICPACDEEPVNRCDLDATTATLGLTGDSVECMVGYARDSVQRANSASGGVLTALLEHLIASKEIDAAVVVSPAGNDGGRLFNAVFARSPEEVRLAAKSKYYPIEMSGVIRQVAEFSGCVAVVGLPCHCKAFAGALEHSSVLRRKVRYIFGLVCGHGVSALYTDFLLAAAGLSLRDVDTVSYRDKEGAERANDFAFVGYKDGKRVGKALRQRQHPACQAWGKRLFVPDACNFCTDCFAEHAHAAFMDAWLPEYEADAQGTSLVVSRNAEITLTLRKMSETGLLDIGGISPDKVAASQAGLVDFKRKRVPARLGFVLRQGGKVPERLQHLADGSRAGDGSNSYFHKNRVLARRIWRLPLPRSIRWRLLAKLAAGTGRISGLLRRIASHE